MPFMVIHRTADGTDRFEQTEAIDEAALHAERLRNSEGIEDVRLFRMEAITFAFRPYYKVELGMPERSAPAPDSPAVGAAEGEGEATAEPAEEAPAEVVAADATEPEGRRGLFGR